MHPKLPGASTDVAEFISDLSGGVFENALSVALSETAAAVVDQAKKGQVTIKLQLEHIPGTQQVRIDYTLTFARPTQYGRRGEEFKDFSAMHVGKGGALTLAQQPLEFDGAKQQPIPGSN